MSAFRLLLSLLVLGMATGLAPAQATRPNVILIMTDDQGYGDLSITGNEFIETPNLDRLAQEGAWLKQFYVSPVCTPTRAHLMTGRYAYRTRAIDTYAGRASMEPEEITLAEVLSDAGYATGIFGKWHLGDYYPTRAMDQGFQQSVVHQGGGLRQPSNPPAGERYHDPILFRNGTPERFEGYCTDIFFSEALGFIEQQAASQKPFFVYLATNAPHDPFDEPPHRELHEHFAGLFPEGDRRVGYYAMIKNIDDNVGRLMRRLKQLGLDENTLVIFLTDNGPSAGSAGPFRGAKGTVYEGGIRTVCFWRWPGKIEAGATSHVPAAHMDIMPTILDFCGVPVPAAAALDGRSIRSLLESGGATEDQLRATLPERYLFLQWHRGDAPQRYHHFAAIDPQGRWKLLSSSNPGRPLAAPPQFELYDLEHDAAEQLNLAAEHPEIVERLKKAYDAWFDDVCHTREPNFGMPPIVIGSDQQATVVLTPQDKRNEPEGPGGWWAPGYWPVDIRREGPYTVEVLLNQEVRGRTTVHLTVEAGEQQRHEQLTIPRGVDSAAIGEVMFPPGRGRIVVRVEGSERDGLPVYQITIK